LISVNGQVSMAISFLIMNKQRITCLSELRENICWHELFAFIRNRRLQKFLTQIGEQKLWKEIEAAADNDEDLYGKKIADLLGLSEAQKEQAELRRKELKARVEECNNVAENDFLQESSDIDPEDMNVSGENAEKQSDIPFMRSHAPESTPVQKAQPTKNKNDVDVNPQFQEIRSIISRQLAVSLDRVTGNASLVEDLGADSLDEAELVMAMESHFGIEIPDEDATKIHTVQDIFNYAERRLRLKTMLLPQQLSSFLVPIATSGDNCKNIEVCCPRCMTKKQISRSFVGLYTKCPACGHSYPTK